MTINVRLAPPLPEWDADTLRHGLISLFHYAQGLKHAQTKPLAKSNKLRVTSEADAIAYVAAFTEFAAERLGIQLQQTKG